MCHDSLITTAVISVLPNVSWQLNNHSSHFCIAKCVMRTAPSYLCNCLQLYTASHTLHSASDTLSLQISHTSLSTVGSHAFSVFGLSTWDDLPLPFQQRTSLDSFKCNLKKILKKWPKLQTCHVFQFMLQSSSISSLCLLPVFCCVNWKGNFLNISVCNLYLLSNSA